MFIITTIIVLVVILGLIAIFREKDDEDIKKANEEHSKKGM